MVKIEGVIIKTNVLNPQTKNDGQQTYIHVC